MLPSGINKHIYDGNGTTRNWDFTFPILTTDGSDMELYKTDADGIISEITSNYYVDVANKYVTYPTIASGLPLLVYPEKITLIRVEPLSQLTDFVNQGPFNAETVEAVADKIVAILQQHAEELSRTTKFSEDQEPTNTEIDAFMLAIEDIGDIEYLVSLAESWATTASDYAAALKDASTTSNTIGTGEKTFTVSADKQFATGQFILIVDAANSANYMHGQVTSYSGTTLVVEVTNTGGSGTKSSWNVYVSGSRGAQGEAGPTSPIPIIAAAGTANAITADYDPPASLTDLTLVAFVAAYANTSTTPTLNVNGQGTRTIVKKGGQSLLASDIPGAGAVCLVEYNLANTRWELLNPTPQDPEEPPPVLSNVIFEWHGCEYYVNDAIDGGLYINDGLNVSTPVAGPGYSFIVIYDSTLRTFFTSKFKKLAGISTITVWGKLWSIDAAGSRSALLKADIGGANVTLDSGTATTPTWVSADIDVSGLTDGTTYDITIQLANQATGYVAFAIGIVLIAS